MPNRAAIISPLSERKERLALFKMEKDQNEDLQNSKNPTVIPLLKGFCVVLPPESRFVVSGAHHILMYEAISPETSDSKFEASTSLNLINSDTQKNK